MGTTIVLGAGPYFPAAAMRDLLERAVPAFDWTCGEGDDGSAGYATVLSDVLVTGWSVAACLAIAICVRDDHGLSCIEIRLSDRDDAALCERVAGAVAAAFAALNPPGYRVHLSGIAGWFDAAGIKAVFEMMLEGERIAEAAARLALAPVSSGQARADLPLDDLLPAGPSHPDALSLAEADAMLADALGASALGAFAATPAFLHEVPRRDRLPTLVLLADAAPTYDWSLFHRTIITLDPGGSWQVRPAGPAETRIIGRGGTIMLHFSEAPLPGWAIERALTRSFWCRPGEGLRRLRRHRAYLTITCDLNTQAAAFVYVRQTAKVMALVLAAAGKSCACAGIYLPAQRLVHAGDTLDGLVGPLLADEVPIRLFVGTAFHSTVDDAISLSTDGMLCFIGREVEAWNAPGDLRFVGGKINGLLRYLLAEGPVIGHGDTLGEDDGERALCIGHGKSRDLGRPWSVPVLLVEFAGPEGGAPCTDPAANRGRFGR